MKIKNHSKKISTLNNFDINSEIKIKQEEEKMDKYLKEARCLQKKVVTKPFLYKISKFVFGNYIAMIGSTRVLPDFIICASPRSGSTSIYEGLLEHPNIFASKIKEVHFFDGNYHRGENWYRYHFPSKLKKLINEKIFEILVTPDFSISSEVIICLSIIYKLSFCAKLEEMQNRNNLISRSFFIMSI